jgi:hypothetical protein
MLLKPRRALLIFIALPLFFACFGPPAEKSGFD